ncbi:hypothetical protein U8V72_20075 [Priestia filamentosa]|uniref:hypothetical protein n=1 Tax=Priestia filamentosa TaxID=1402861 RepID=UPI00397E0C97
MDELKRIERFCALFLAMNIANFVMIGLNWSNVLHRHLGLAIGTVVVTMVLTVLFMWKYKKVKKKVSQKKAS